MKNIKQNIEDIYPLSPLQQGMLFHTIYQPGSELYFEQSSWRLKGKLNVPVVREAWQHVVDRYTVLRTGFLWEGLEEPLQVVYRSVEVPFTVLDWRDLPDSETDEHLEAFFAADREAGFELATAPLMRLTLVQLADAEYILIWSHHHLLLDGWSQPLIFQAFFTWYQSLLRGKTAVLPPTRSYKDYIQWLQVQDLGQAETFWREYLEGFTFPTSLNVYSVSDPPPEEANQTYTRRAIHIDHNVSQALNSLVQKHHLTLNTVLQGAWGLLLSRYSGLDDVVFGATVSGRPPDLAYAEAMVGLFINTLPLRIQIDPGQSVLSWLKHLQVENATLRQYEYTPLVEAKRWSAIPQDQPLFETLFVFENYPVGDEVRQQMAGFEIQSTRSFTRTNYPFTISLTPGERIGVEVAFENRRFDSETVTRLLGHFKTLLAGIASDPERPISSVPLLTTAEHKQILVNWNATETDIPQRYVHELIHEQALRTPDAIAAVFGDQQLIYKELDLRVNQLAHYLQKLGVKPEVPVGLCITRSIEMLVGILGILSAGGCYTPMPPEYPDERLALMLSDTQAPVVLTHSHLVERIEYLIHNARGESPDELDMTKCRSLVQLDTDWPIITEQSTDFPVTSLSLDSLAYIIYTSGSTGRPKGVLIQHRGFTNLVLDWRQDVGLVAGDRVLQFLSYGFDGSISELFPALTVGATLYLIPEKLTLAFTGLHDYLKEQDISVLTMTPSALAVLSSKDLPALKTVIAGGERCPPALVDKWGRGRRFINVYGPTEATVTTSFYALDDGRLMSSGNDKRPTSGSFVDDKHGLPYLNNDKMSSIPIGRPVSNFQVYVLDRYLRPVPVGVPGELYIAGIGLARGYLNRAALTNERFIPNPFDNALGSRLYKTGDLVCYWPDGNIQFLGRTDNQVKVRGFRIELGEIEAVLTTHPDVLAAVVMAPEDQTGQNYLVAYLVPEVGTSLNPTELQAFLKQQLPPYMIPAIYISLESFPLTASGKVNRKALPSPEDMRTLVTANYVAPRTSVERGLADIWTQVLNIRQVGIYDNFFELGGHSLLATLVISRACEIFNVPLSVSVLFESPTINELAHHLETALRDSSGVSLPIIEPRQLDEDNLPLSFAQQRLWFLEQLAPGNLLYNIPTVVKLKGKLDVIALEQSLNMVVARHEVLRTTFQSIDGRPVQVVASELPIPLPTINLPGQTPEKALRRLLKEEIQQPFDFVNGPLLRFKLLHLVEDEHIIILTMHHIITDGWSFGVFIREVAAIYAALTNDISPQLLPLPIQYADFALWQREWLQGEILTQQLDYWKEQLQGAPPLLELPTDHPYPPVRTSNGDTFTFSLPESLSGNLRDLGQEEGVTLFMILLAAFQVLLYRYTGQEDINVGTPIANRNHIETENLIGFFVNTLVMRGDLSGNPSFRELLGRVREVALGAYAHQDLPFEMLVEALQPHRDMSHTPLFQVMFVLDNPTVESMVLPELSLIPVEVQGSAAIFDITLSIADTARGLYGYFEYNTDLFEVETIARMAGHFETLLGAIISNPDWKISTLPILTQVERQQVLVDWNATDVPFPDNVCVHQLFEEQVRTRPDAIALMMGTTRLTYNELNQRANQLAHYLRKIKVGPEVLVGISTARSPEMVIGILGILKAGGAYLPLDPTYPAERLAFMIADSQISVLLTQSHLISTLSSLPLSDENSSLVHIIQLDTQWPVISKEGVENPGNQATADHAAYVIYTSGSTGKPKGAILRHRGLCNLTAVQQHAFSIQEGSRILQFSPFSFDASVWETFMALANGATLCLAHQDTLAAAPDLVNLLREAQITNVTLPPSMLRMLPVEDLPDLKTVIAAGEACTLELVKGWAPSRDFFNAYGPTETTVCASMYLCDAAEFTPPPIGKPISNCQLYILDKNMQPVPVGVPGELHIGGVNLARGYLNRAELTAKKFVHNPFSTVPGDRLYKTGDLVRYRMDGDIEFLGRIDNQVKVRGFRIELGEIENVLEEHSDLRDVAVIVREDVPGDRRIVAYLTTKNEKQPTVNELRAWAQRTLPDYMVPSAFVFMDVLPVSPAGKIDRRSLPVPEGLRPELEYEYVAPRTPVEERLVGIGAELLQIDSIGVYDNFFDLGGHSLLATQFISRVRDAFEVEIPLRSLFEHPTIAGLAEQIEIASRRGDTSAVPTIQRVSRDTRRVKRSALVHSKVDDASDQ